MTSDLKLGEITLWTTAGLLLSLYCSPPLWAIVGEPDRFGPIFWPPAVVGAAAAAVGHYALPARVRVHSPTFFSAAYLPLIWWAWFWDDRALRDALYFVLTLGACFGLVTLGWRESPEFQRWLSIAAAMLLWLAVIVLMPMYLVGLYFAPPAIALTLTACRYGGTQRTEPKSMTADSAA